MTKKGSGKANLSTIIEDLIKKMSKIWILVFHDNFDPPLHNSALATINWCLKIDIEDGKKNILNVI